MTKHLASWALAAALWSLTSGAIEAQHLLGAEFQVNSYTPAFQASPSIAGDTESGFVVVWDSNDGQDGNASGIFARRFNGAGTPLGLEFRVNSRTTDSQFRPAVARDGDGDFVITWQSLGQDGDSVGVFARRFASSGTAQGVEFQVSSFTQNGQVDSDVALDADGDFMVVWSSFAQDADGYGIFARRFSSSGSPIGAELMVNTFTVNSQSTAAVAADAGGGFVVAWESFAQDGDVGGIFARRFTSAGAPGAAFAVNGYTQGFQGYPSVGMDSLGRFVVTWQSADASGYGIFARRFDTLGSPQAAEFRVNSFTAGDQRTSSVDLDSDGDFVVAWESYAQEDAGYHGIFARTFNASGFPEGVEFQVNTHTADEQLFADAILGDDGQLVIAWESRHAGSGFDIYAQRAVAPAVLDIDANGSVGALTDGLLVLRFLFGFTGTTLTSGVVGAGCTRCNAATIEPYLEGLV